MISRKFLTSAKFSAALALVLLLGLSAAAQQIPKGERENNSDQNESKSEVRKEPSFYRLEYVLREIEAGKTVNTRTYTMSVGGSGVHMALCGSLRSGTRVPVTTDKEEKLQYIDVGVNIDCTLNDENGAPYFRTAVEVSSLAPPGPEQQSMRPVVHQTKASLWSPLVVGKPMLLLAADDPASPRKLEVEVIATKLK